MKEQLLAEQLHASEERFHTLVDAVSDYAIFMLDPAGHVLTWNTGARKITGRASEEIIGKHFSFCFTPEDDAAGRPQQALDIARREGRHEEQGWRVHKDGSRFWAHVVLSALRDPQGELTGFAKVMRDLTVQRVAQERLRQSEERFHTLVDAVTDYAIFRLDATGHVATWNSGAERTKGYRADEIIGKHFSVFYTPEDQAAGKPAQVLETVRREGRFEDEAWRVRKDGTRFWADVVLTALRNLDGQVVGFAKVTRDLTLKREAQDNERRLAREQLARAASEGERQRLLTLLKQVPARVNFFRGPELVFEFAHPKTVAAMGGRDIEGKPLRVACPERIDNTFCERVRRVYETGEPLTQHEARRSHLIDGRHIERYSNLVYLPVRDASGAVEGVMTFELDVTEAVVARKEMERVNRAKDEFLATMSHELRTPLNAIYGWATILRRKPREEGKLERGLEVIERNAQAQTRIVSDLLDVSRIITGKLELKLQMTDLFPLVLAAVDVVRPAADGKRVRLTVDVDPQIGATMADADRVQQIVWNLLINAVRFTPRGGRVTITGDRVGSNIIIRVQDSGAGIPVEHLPHIFERFTQVDSSTTRTHSGLGLGLAIVRHLVEAHGGSVEAKSEGPGQGATFTVTLPVRGPQGIVADADACAALAEAEAEAESAAGQGPPDLDRLKILVVDDDPDSLDVVRMVLETAGAKVTTVASARAAFELLDTRGAFDVIISDIGMPEMDGYSFMRGVRSRPSAELVPAIALTAYARAEDAKLAECAGYQEHLSKPVDQKRLIQAVKTWTLRATASSAPGSC